ncbi:predicted protein [Arabidopsis lyrata subsp. lyrata]|uniref:Predicted protein n=1 Tax=Arabidopsis lyrata subsp. lyrata TaxID=81972 RepID=D7LSA3_ARALL|nr:predicted protein [Arabidopsis lyrata subsp. lyrata]
MVPFAKLGSLRVAGQNVVFSSASDAQDGRNFTVKLYIFVPFLYLISHHL